MFLRPGEPVLQFLLAWSAIRLVLHSPCICHEGGCKSHSAFSGDFLAQDEGCQRCWQPSPFSTSNTHMYLKWCSSFGVSWGRHQAAAITEARSCRYGRATIIACIRSDSSVAQERLNAPLARLSSQRENVIVCLPRASVPRWPSAPGYCWGSPTSAVLLHQLLLQF